MRLEVVQMAVHNEMSYKTYTMIYLEVTSNSFFKSPLKMRSVVFNFLLLSSIDDKICGTLPLVLT